MSFELEQTTTLGLLDEATAIRRSKRLARPDREDAQFDIWQASVGSLTREVVADELMFILTGSATFVGEDGESIEKDTPSSFLQVPGASGTFCVTCVSSTFSYESYLQWVPECTSTHG